MGDEQTKTAPVGLADEGGSQQDREASARPFVLTLMAGTALAAYLVQPFWSSLFLSAVLAMSLYPAQTRLSAMFRGRRTLAGAVVTLCLLAFIVVPLASIAVVAVREVTQGLQWMRDSLGIDSLRDLSNVTMPPKVDKMLTDALGVLHMSRSDLQEYVGRALGVVQNVAPSFLSASVGAVGTTLFVLVAFFFFTIDGERVVKFSFAVSPLRAHQTEELFQEFRSVSSAALLGTVVTSLIIGGVVAAGFAFAGVPHALFFGIVTVIAGFVPVVGSALIWVPAALLIGMNGRVGVAIALTVWCTLGVAIADNVIKPILMRGKSEMHVGLMFLSLLGGLAMFGGIGILAGPVIMAFFLSLLRIYVRDYANPGERNALGLH